MKIYDDKPKNYFANARTDLIQLLPKNPKSKILEIGAGSGATLLTIKELNLAEEVVGIELFTLENSHQTDQRIDKFIFGNIEEINLPFPENYFDIIICADVLEHLIDPWSVLKKIQPYLKKEGVLIVSIPNIREFSILYKLFIKGDFAYTESGILDKTHLRFFCKKNVVELIESGGFKVKQVDFNFIINPLGRKRRVLNRFSFGIFKDFLASQYLVSATKL